jgi:hypothetical protein
MEVRHEWPYHFQEEEAYACHDNSMHGVELIQSFEQQARIAFHYKHKEFKHRNRREWTQV